MAPKNTGLNITQNTNGTTISTENVLVIETSELNIQTNADADWKFTLLPQLAAEPYILADTESRNSVYVHDSNFTAGGDYVQVSDNGNNLSKILVNVSALDMTTSGPRAKADAAGVRANTILKRFGEGVSIELAIPDNCPEAECDKCVDNLKGIGLNHGGNVDAVVQGRTLDVNARDVYINEGSKGYSASMEAETINISSQSQAVTAVDTFTIGGEIHAAREVIFGNNDKDYTLSSGNGIAITVSVAETTDLTIAASDTVNMTSNTLAITYRNTFVRSTNTTIDALWSDCNDECKSEVNIQATETFTCTAADNLNIEALCCDGGVDFTAAGDALLTADKLYFNSTAIVIDTGCGDLDFTNTILTNMDQTPNMTVESITHDYVRYSITSEAPAKTTLSCASAVGAKVFHIVDESAYPQGLAASLRKGLDFTIMIDRGGVTEETLTVERIGNSIYTITGAGNAHAFGESVEAVNPDGSPYTFDGLLTLDGGDSIDIFATDLNINSRVVNFDAATIQMRNVNLKIKGEFVATTATGYHGYHIVADGNNSALTFTDGVSFEATTDKWDAVSTNFNSNLECKHQILYEGLDSRKHHSSNTHDGAVASDLRFCDIFTDNASAFAIDAAPAQVIVSLMAESPYSSLRADASLIITTERLANGSLRYKQAELGDIHELFSDLYVAKGLNDWADYGLEIGITRLLLQYNTYDAMWQYLEGIIEERYTAYETTGDLLPIHIVPYLSVRVGAEAVGTIERTWSVLKLYVPGTVKLYKHVNLGEGIPGELYKGRLYNGRWLGVSNLLRDNDIIEIKTSDNIYVGASNAANIENTEWDVDTLITHSESVFSDKRLKKEIQTVESESLIRKVKQLQGVIYNWKDSEDNKPVSGFIAQDAVLVFPEIVNTDNSAQLSVDYNQVLTVIPFLCQKIKLLESKINAL